MQPIDQNEFATTEAPDDRGLCVLHPHQLVKASWNYKEEDDAKAAALAQNIQRNGQLINSIVRPLPDGEGGYQSDHQGRTLFEIVDGNHRKDAFLELGIERVLCYNLGATTQAEAKRISAETDPTFDRDPLAFAEVLADVESEFGRDDILDTLPFSDEELSNYGDMLDFDWEDMDDEPGPADEGETGEGEHGDNWESFEVVMHEDQMGVWEEAKDAVRHALDEEGIELHDDPALLRGQVLELIAADYLSGAADLSNHEARDDAPF